MLLPNGQHLGYCTNVHPYADQAGLLDALSAHAAPLRERLQRAGRLAPGAPLGVGLWLPCAVAEQVARDPAPLRDRLLSCGLYAFTVNAFPYGDFHAGRVKDEVFRPTWADPRRVQFTLLAAEALASLLPRGTTGSLSTHAGGYRPWGAECPDAAAVARGLMEAATGLARLEQRTGRYLLLALEPEPLSLLETTDEVVRFFEAHLWPHGDVARRHIGLCYDACHQAVEFEDLQASIAALRAAGIALAKVQLSCALSVQEPWRHVDELARYAEDRWFHQVVVRRADGRLLRLPDLPDALQDLRTQLRAAAGASPRGASPEPRAGEMWRVHFHVPLFAERLGAGGVLGTTKTELAELLTLVGSPDVTTQLEIETYSYALIPEDQRVALGAGTLLQCQEREFAWVLDQLALRD